MRVSLGLDVDVRHRRHHALRSGDGEAAVFDRDRRWRARNRDLRHLRSRDADGRHRLVRFVIKEVVKPIGRTDSHRLAWPLRSRYGRWRMRWRRWSPALNCVHASATWHRRARRQHADGSDAGEPEAHGIDPWGNQDLTAPARNIARRSRKATGIANSEKLSGGWRRRLSAPEPAYTPRL